MFETQSYSGSMEKKYQLLIKQAEALLEGEKDTVANLANASALLNQFLPDVNWVGFYILKNNELVLGPFQGLPACVRIMPGKGVCGTAITEKRTMRIVDVHQFPGHIACDAASQSEIVIPLYKKGEIYGVLDIDSPKVDRFNELDQKNLEKFAAIIEKYI